MGKVKCTCEKGTHHNQSQRLKCLTLRGQIKRNGFKRTEMDVSNISARQNTDFYPNQKQIDQEDTESNNFIPLHPIISNNTVQIISNVSLLRNGYRRKEYNTSVFKNCNFTRMVKDDKPLPNILEQFALEQGHLNDLITYRSTDKRRKNLISLIRLLDNREDIFCKIQNLCSMEYTKYLENQSSDNLKTPNQIKQYVGKRKNIESLYSKQWEKHFNKIRKGKIGKYDASLYHIQQLIQQGQWSKIVEMEQKYQKILELENLSLQARAEYNLKQSFFDQFAQITLAEIQPLLYMYQKRITRSQDGKILKFQKIKLCRINKYQYKQMIDMHLKQVKPRFQRFWNYFYNYHNQTTAFHGVVKDDLLKYPQIAHKLKNYFAVKKKIYQQRIKQEINKNYEERMQKKRNLIDQQVNFGSQTTDRESNQNIYFKVIQTEFDFIETLNKLLKIKQFYGRQAQDSNIAYKIFLLESSSIRFIPQGDPLNPFPLDAFCKWKQVIIIKFRQKKEIRQMLDKYLQPFYFRFQFGVQSFQGYLLQYKKKELKIEKNNIQINEKQHQYYFYPREDREKQINFIKKYANYADILSHIDFLLFLNKIRGKKTIKKNKLIGKDKVVQEFLDSFRHLFLTNGSYVWCPQYKVSQMEERCNQVENIEA